MKQARPTTHEIGGSPDGSNDRRRTPRYSCHGPINFRVEGWYLHRGRIRNLCLDGCLLEPMLHTGCVPGEYLDLRFEVNRLPFLAHCIVRRVHPSGALGVEILRLSERGRSQLHQLIGELALLTPASEES